MKKSLCGILFRLWFLGHPYGLLVVSTYSEGAPQNNHEEGKKPKPHSWVCKQQNWREIKWLSHQSKLSVILIWSQMRSIFETKRNVIHTLFFKLKKEKVLHYLLMKDRLMYTFTSYISLKIYTRLINMPHRGKIFEAKIRNTKAYDRTQNVFQLLVWSVGPSRTSDHFWGDQLSCLGFSTRSSQQVNQMGTVAFFFRQGLMMVSNQDFFITSKAQIKQKTKLISRFNL